MGKVKHKELSNWVTFYHNQREADLLNFKTIEREGVEVPIIKPIYDEATGCKNWQEFKN